VNVWVRTGKLSKLTDSVSLGSKKAILSWDISDKTIRLDEVDDKNLNIGTIFATDVQSIDRAFFMFGKDFTIAVQKVRYDLSLRSLKVNSPLLTDALQVADGGVLSGHSDIKSDLGNLRVFLKQEIPKATYISRTTSRAYLTIAIVIFVVILIGVIASYAGGRISAK
jgi:hypothetical protein